MKKKRCFGQWGILACLVLLINISVHGQSATKTVKPFEITIFGNENAMPSFLMITLTDKQVRIIQKGVFAGDKDSVLYTAPLTVTDTLQQIGDIDTDELKGFYTNRCIEEGIQFSVIIKKAGKTKSVFVSNFYQPEIGKIIYLINTTVPEQYRITYDKDKLIADFNNCGGN